MSYNLLPAKTLVCSTPPPGRHGVPAEKAVQIYKSCYKSVANSLLTSFLISYWCQLLEQCNISVNMMRRHRHTQKLLVWAAMKGKFNFDSTLIAPPGSQMLMQVKPESRRTCGINAKKAWYTGPCPNHYHTVKGILPSTNQSQEDLRRSKVLAPHTCHLIPNPC